MSVKIDTVYQRVLALANKEQRGYITPQEFNLLANQAQMEIFEEYFYDQNQADRNLKNSTEFSNIDEMLDEKISYLKQQATISLLGSGIGNLPISLYRLGMVHHLNDGVEIEQLTEEELLYVNNSPLVKPNKTFSAFTRPTNSTIRVYPSTVGGCVINYIGRPAECKWAYVVVNEKALYNATLSVDFNIHRSEESQLVYRILALAGITIAKPGLSTYADQQTISTKQQEKQ